MTENEVLERARHIWGERAAIHAELRHNGGAALVIDNVWHQLDPNGHPNCHSKCEDLEADAEHRRSLDERQELRQLVSEAVALLDPEHQDHDKLDVKDWLNTARTLLQRTHHHA